MSSSVIASDPTPEHRPDALDPLVVAVPYPRLTQALAPRYPQVRFIQWDLDSPAPRGHIDLLVLPYPLDYRRLTELSGMDISVVQSPLIGYEGAAQHLPPGMTLCNAATVHELPTAELALGLILADLRGIADFVRAQQRAHWDYRFTPGLVGRRVLLVGFGGVGRALASLVAPFGAEVTAAATHARVQDGVRVVTFDDATASSGPLTQADVVVLAVPLTQTTHRLVGTDFLSRMKDGALLVNVGRGPTVDTEALLAEVRTGRLRAALDVTDPEPLPVGHPLWHTPGVTITPHVGGSSQTFQVRLIDLLARQIDALLAGEPPANIVAP